MAKKKLTDKDRLRALSLGTSEGAESYGEWLGSKKEDALALTRLAAEGEARREAVGYGAKGEALAKSGLADDGYAAYLRRAAKEARESRLDAIEAERESADRAALVGYADYLERERAKSGERLLAAAEELTASPLTRGEVEKIVSAAGGGSDAKAFLRSVFRTVGTDRDRLMDVEESTSAVLAYLKETRLPYERAYEYCRNLGYTPKEAQHLASLAEQDLDDLTRLLHDMFE